MRAVRDRALLGALVALIFSLCAARDIVVAQTSMGAPEMSSPSPPPSTPTAPQTVIPPPGIIARQTDPPSSSQTLWGAIGFTADGSYSTVWKQESKGQAEAEAAKGCAKFGRGSCEVVSFTSERCVALATFIGSYGRRRWRLSFTAGAETYPESQRAAMQRCNSDERTGGRCQLRTAVCADGR